MSKSMTLGIVRSLSSKYVEIKRNLNSNPKRISLNDSGSLINDNGKINLISKKDDNHVELSNWHLPPKYVELFDSTNDVFKELLIKFSRLQEDQQRRIMPKFDDDENKKIDKLIRENIREMTKKIKECEDNIRSMSLEKISTEKEKLVRDNMKQNLVSKLTDFTRKLKMNEEEYMKKYRELVGDDLNYQNTNQASNKSGRTDENFLKFETSNDILVKRDNEINNLLNSINELSSIFKDFQTLVLEQGTILDRIDYNIETAFENTKKAHVDLEKANKNMEKNCARNANLVLLVIIFIMSILIIFKYF